MSFWITFYWRLQLDNKKFNWFLQQLLPLTMLVFYCYREACVTIVLTIVIFVPFFAKLILILQLHLI